ncbi:MAG: hypothetical protein ACREFQ_01880, partial [Stellaceae bacterium]
VLPLSKGSEPSDFRPEQGMITKVSAGADARHIAVLAGVDIAFPVAGTDLIDECGGSEGLTGAPVWWMPVSRLTILPRGPVNLCKSPRCSNRRQMILTC